MALFGDKNPGRASKSAFRKPTSEEAPKTKSVDEIWSAAMEQIAKDYNLSSNDFEKWDGSLGEGETGIEKARALFAKSRHSGEKKDKVMSTVGNCLEWVQDGLGFVKNNISGTYAVPIQTLTGSISYMVQAAETVSEDFDRIESTFETLNNALAEIGDLREFNFKSDSNTFLERLTAIFVAMVRLCALSGKVFWTSRTKRWFKALLGGKDQEIQGACADVEKAIRAFRDIVPLQTLGQMQIMATAMQDVPDRVIEQIQTKLKHSELQPLLGRTQKSLDMIKDLFKRSNLFHPEVEARKAAHMALVDKQLVGGTFSWTNDDSTYQAWESGRKAPYLFILGTPGSGKTFFACHCYNSIQRRSVKTMATSEDSSERKRAPFVTYFPFKIGREESQGLGSVLAYTILQAAMQDTKLRDSMAKDLHSPKDKDLFEKGKDVDSEKRIKFLWQNLLVKKFERTTEASRELFIILDSVEVMSESDRKLMLDLFQELSPEKCGIRILMTGTESAVISKKGSGLSGCPKITLDEKIRKENDINTIMQFRIDNSERLKSYSKKTWDTVEQKLLDSPNPISTVDITMTVMAQADSEKGGIDMIKKLTKENGPYETMIQSVLLGKSDKEREFFRFIFALCTFAQRPLSIYVLREFSKQESIFRNSDLDVAHQIETCLSNLLYVTNTSDEELAVEAGQGEDKKEDKVAISKVQMVTFRQTSFLEYLNTNKNGLIPEPVKSRVSFFVKLTNLLCGKDTESAGLRDAFQDYAARWFMEHLKAIDVKKADPTEGHQVVEALSRVFRNDGDVSQIFERILGHSEYYHAHGTDIYEISTDPGSGGFDNLKVLREWANKMNFHDEEDLSSQAKEWVEGTIHAPHKMLENLARGHFQKWTETKVYEEAKVPYNFLRRAIRLRQEESDQLEGTGVTEIKSLLKYATDGRFLQTPIQIARCQISAALVLHNDSSDEENREFARELYQTTLQQKRISGPEKFYSHLGLAEHFYEAKEEGPEAQEADKTNQRWKLVLAHADEALRVWLEQKGALGSDLNEARCIKAFALKAHALHQLENDEEAINTCHQCLEEAFQYNPQISQLLSLLVDIHSKNKNWAQLIDLVWQQKPDVRAEFLNYLFCELDTLDKTYLMMEAAVKSSRVDYLIRIVEGAREYGEDKDGPQLLYTTWMLAHIYQIAARVPQMAESLMTNGIPDSNKYSMAYAYVVFPSLVTIYQEYFMSACSKKAQLDSVEKLVRVIKSYEQNAFQESSALSMAELSLAKMYLGLGNTQQVESHVNRAFDICIIDLKDSIASNDRDAFRALAKALEFLGLETEARVALSLMFSRVGGADDELSLPEETYSVISSPDTDVDKAEEAEENEIIGMIDTTKASTDEDATPPSNEEIDQESKGSELMPPPNGEETQSAAPAMPRSPFSESDEQPEDQAERTLDAQPKQSKGSGFVFSQDLNFGAGEIGCNGVCEPRFEVSSFKPEGPKLMYCMDCMDVDFCEACHTKQINFFDKRENGFWFKCCWARHAYLQAPIDGWLGVKNGFIYMEHRVDDKLEIRKVQFEDWLIGVKSRWKKRINNTTIWNELRARQRPEALF